MSYRVCLLFCLFQFAAQAQDSRLTEIRDLLIPMRAKKPDNSPSRGAGPKLTEVKHLLRDWVESRLPELHWYADPKKLELTLNEELKQTGLFCQFSSWPNNNPCSDGSALGFLGPVKLDIQKNGSYLVLQTSMGIQECGVDESAYAYQSTGDRWQPFWQSEQDDYSEKKYVPQTLYAVDISPVALGQPENLVLTLGSHSSCMSAWHSIFIRAWRAQVGGLEPRLLLDEQDFAWLGTEPPVQGTIGPNDILVEYSVGSIDAGVLWRQEIRHFLIKQDELVRVDPLVLSPRDFVDEWIRHPWSEMSGWTESNALPALRNLHETWSAAQVHGEFIWPPRHCPRKPDLWQVGINLEKDSGKNQIPEYFLVRWRPPYSFTMVRASSRPFSGCTEEDPKAEEFHTLFPGTRH
jgi:hypothetical protein